MKAKTLYDKLWDAHVVRTDEQGFALIYIDRLIVYEVSSPQAFEGLRQAARRPRRPLSILATADHNVPTTNRDRPIADEMARVQIETLGKNAVEFGTHYFPLGDPRQGIVHVIGPEQGATLPGMTVVCGDSHTATHGALGALAFGIGTSETEHVMATQCLPQAKSKTMLIKIDGTLSVAVSAKDLILAVIREIGTAGATGYALEFGGSTIRSMSMEGRLTICNMAIEAGARVGLVGVDEITLEYVQGRPFAPSGAAWEMASRAWRDLKTDQDAVFDRVVEFDASLVVPQVSWGTSPEMVVGIGEKVPDPRDEPDPVKRGAQEKALNYMGLVPGTSITDIQVDRVFIGSCTNSRIEDLRAAAAVLVNRTLAPTIKQALVVPGSGLIKAQAEAEGLDRIFQDAGFEWRDAGCSMCVALNDDRLLPQERSASTSNRNFEGRQGPGARTHLVSPAMAAAAGVFGHFVDVGQIGLP